MLLFVKGRVYNAVDTTLCINQAFHQKTEVEFLDAHRSKLNQKIYIFQMYIYSDSTKERRRREVCTRGLNVGVFYRCDRFQPSFSFIPMPLTWLKIDF